MTKRKKGTLIALAILTVVLCALFVFLCIWFFADRYPAFDKIAKEEVQLAGTDDGFAPQGLCFAGEETVVCGYTKDASRIYFLGKTPRYVTVRENGKLSSAHFGGIACDGEYLFVTSGKRLLRISLAEALSKKNGEAVDVKDAFTSKLSNAFCFIEGDLLYAGEFYRAGNYETEASHHMEKNGEMNEALVYAYEKDETATGGWKSEPKFAISIRGLVQGFAIAGEEIFLSCSYGLPNSTIYVYTNILGGETKDTFEGVPLYRLDKTNLLRTLDAPCMSEGIAVKEGRLFVLFESDAQKYRLFVRRRIQCVYSLPLSLS